MKSKKRVLREHFADPENMNKVGLKPTALRKLESDIYIYIKRGEYEKANELVLLAIKKRIISLDSIWRMMIELIDRQDGNMNLGKFISTLASGIKDSEIPKVHLENVFLTLLRSRISEAELLLRAYVESYTGTNTRMYGYHGIVVACMREEEIRKKWTSTKPPKESKPHIFGSNTEVEFRLTKVSKSKKAESTRYTLKQAEEDIFLALESEPDNELFILFYTQVLFALRKYERARSFIEKAYENSECLTFLRALISITDSDDPNYLSLIQLYCKKDPFAPTDKFLEPLILKHYQNNDDDNGTDKLSKEEFETYTRICIDRIEMGNTNDTETWLWLGILLQLGRVLYPDVLGAIMKPRLCWWKDCYFSANHFSQDTKEIPAELTIYRAVCGQQLFDFKKTHPIYTVLASDMDSAIEEYVNDNIRLSELDIE